MTSLRIVAGGIPTDEELAAVVAVLSLVQARGTSAAEPEAPSRWRHSARPAPLRRDGWLAASRRSALRAGR